MKLFRKHALGSYLVLLLSFIFIYRLNEGDLKPKAPKSFLSPPAMLKHFTFGYNESLADSMWLRVIQDLDFCDAKRTPSIIAAPNPNGTNLCHATSKCGESWVYHMLDSITEIAPNYRQAYYSGTNELSIIVGDCEGAAHMYLKAFDRFPHDWQLEYFGANHFLQEAKDPKLASEILLRAARDGAPQWTYALAGKLMTQQGQAQLALPVLRQALEDVKDEGARYRIQVRIKEAEAALKN